MKKISSASSLLQLSSEDEKELSGVFGKKNKTPDQNLGCFYVTTASYLKNPTNATTAGKFEKYLSRVKNIFHQPATPVDEALRIELSKNYYVSKALVLLILNSRSLAFEMKKDIVTIVHDLLKVADQSGTHHAAQVFSEYADDIIRHLFDLFKENICICFAGPLLKILITREETSKKILTPRFLQSIQFLLESSQFEVHSSGSEVLKGIFNPKKESKRRRIAEFIRSNYEDWQATFDRLMNSSSYMTRRCSLIVLYNILSDPIYSSVKTEYLNRLQNLVQIMHLLMDSKSTIQKEAFVVLELFVNNLKDINEEKIKLVLWKNKLNLTKLVKSLKEDKGDDAYFNKELILHELEEIPDH